MKLDDATIALIEQSGEVYVELSIHEFYALMPPDGALEVARLLTQYAELAKTSSIEELKALNAEVVPGEN